MKSFRRVGVVLASVAMSAGLLVGVVADSGGHVLLEARGRAPAPAQSHR